MSKAQEMFGWKSEPKSLHALLHSFIGNVLTAIMKSQYMFSDKTTSAVYGKCD